MVRIAIWWGTLVSKSWDWEKPKKSFWPLSLHIVANKLRALKCIILRLLEVLLLVFPNKKGKSWKDTFQFSMLFDGWTRCHVSKDDPSTLRKNPAPGDHSPIHQRVYSKGGTQKGICQLVHTFLYVHSQEAIFSLCCKCRLCRCVPPQRAPQRHLLIYATDFYTPLPNPPIGAKR
jgi:hypothetical protein